MASAKLYQQRKKLKLIELNGEIHSLFEQSGQGTARWSGVVRGNKIVLPDFGAVMEFCRINGLRVER